MNSRTIFGSFLRKKVAGGVKAADTSVAKVMTELSESHASFVYAVDCLLEGYDPFKIRQSEKTK